MNRRGFLGSILALGVAPAIVRADSLMRIIAPRPIAMPPELQQFVVSSVSEGGLSIAAITREGLRIAHESSAFIHSLNAGNSFRVGDIITLEGVNMPPQADTLRIRLPKRYKAEA